MLLYTFVILVINLIHTILVPFSFTSSFVFNVFDDIGFISLVKVWTLFVQPSTIFFFMSTFIFWTSIFIFRPIINIIRNKG